MRFAYRGLRDATDGAYREDRARAYAFAGRTGVFTRSRQSAGREVRKLWIRIPVRQPRRCNGIIGRKGKGVGFHARALCCAKRLYLFQRIPATKFGSVVPIVAL